MNPKRVRDISPIIAEKYGLTITEVEDLINFFYKDYLKQKLSEVSAPSIQVPNLGTFKVIKPKIDGWISFYEMKLKNIVKRKLKAEMEGLDSSGLNKDLLKYKTIINNLNKAKESTLLEQEKIENYKTRLQKYINDKNDE